MILGLAALPFAVRAAEELPTADNLKKPLLGSWFVTAGQMSIVFSLEASGEALVLFVEGGAVTIGRHLWRPMPGGLLIDTLPRFRLWQSSGPCEVRVEMEELPQEVEVSDGFKHFPLRFCMKRVTHAPLPRELIQRPPTKGWEVEALDEDWEKKAGVRR